MKTAYRKINLFFVFLIMLFIVLSFGQFADAVDYDAAIKEKESEIKEKQAELEESKNREYLYEQQGLSAAQTVDALKNDLAELESDIEEFQQDLIEAEDMVENQSDEVDQKETDLKEVSKELYKLSRASVIEIFLSSGDLSELIKRLGIQKYGLSVVISEFRDEQEELAVVAATFNDLSDYVVDLGDEIYRLDTERAELESAKAWYEMMAQLENAKQDDLLSDISKLTAQQQALIAARSGGSNINVNSVPNSGDPYASLAGFRANAPGGYFGVFSIGAYTHRNGMSQWGAKARSDAGQSYSQILSFYYPGGTVRTGTVVISGVTEDIMENISISGYGTKSFEDYYLLGIHEINGAWNTSDNMEVLKAQVIAARTYAVRATNNGDSSICTTESCQVFSTPLYSGAWATAVAETEGMILADSSGNPLLTQYAAVHGGWVNNVGWDTTDGSGSGDWMARAWDSISGVSWFYKSWYRETYSDSSSSCGRYPWLSQEEMADLINLYLVIKEVDLKKTPDTSRFLPVTLASCPISGVSGNPYSMAEMRGLLNIPVTSVSYATASIANGNTSSVTFGTNRGTITMSGYDFKQVYSIRSPGYLRIPQSGFQHFNIEMN